MEKYPVIIYWSEEDNRYLAEMPDLPGCIADGTTEEEVRRNIAAVALDWVKMAAYMGRSIPAPTPEVAA